MKILPRLTLSAALLAVAAGARSQEPNGKPPSPKPEPAVERPAALPAAGQAGKQAPAAGAKTSLLMPDTDLIDIPTAGVMDQGGFSSRTRFFSDGGLLEWINFGIFPRVNLGASLNVEKIVGTNSPVQLTRPELQLKMRFFDGDRIIPAFALGFDGQGYLYNRPSKVYNQRQRGLYFVGTQEIGLPGLQAHAGVNISDFDTNKIFGFMGTSLNVMDKVMAMVEWDNINNYFDSRVNMGLRTYVTPGFHIDFAVRAVGQAGVFANNVKRSPERVVQFKYTGNF